MWMRGGMSKGGYFLAVDFPAERAARDAFLLRVMGSPDPRQIDGLGGADPLTSKVAVVRRSVCAGDHPDRIQKLHRTVHQPQARQPPHHRREPCRGGRAA